MSFKNKTVFITGASRGIGKAIGLKLAADGANIVIAAKTSEPNAKLPGTIYSAAEEIEAAGGQALPLMVDIRDETAVQQAVQQAAEHFGGIDILINNASAIQLTNTEFTPMKRFDLMMSVNARGTYLCSQTCLPYLKKSSNPHILMLSPPLVMQARWFKNHVAYTMAKYGMSMCVLGMAEEFKSVGVAVNALWPRTAIATAAVKNLLGGDGSIQKSRTPEIVADAAFHILQQPSKTCSGHFFIDEEVIAQYIGGDMRHYQVDPNVPSSELIEDFFLP